MTPFPVLDGLPEPELQATRLDGHSYRVGDAHLPIGVPLDPASRASIAVLGRSQRLIPALGTASWIWGAVPTPPVRYEFLVELTARWRPRTGDAIEVIESVVRTGDLAKWGAVRVTTPLRTALDLARFRTVFTLVDAAAVRSLADTGGFTLDDARRAMDRGRNLAGKQLASERLESCLGPLSPS